MVYCKFDVGWESEDDSEFIGSYYAESEQEAILEAKKDLRYARIKFPVRDVVWFAVIR